MTRSECSFVDNYYFYIPIVNISRSKLSQAVFKWVDQAGSRNVASELERLIRALFSPLLPSVREMERGVGTAQKGDIMKKFPNFLRKSFLRPANVRPKRKGSGTTYGQACELKGSIG